MSGPTSPEPTVGDVPEAVPTGAPRAWRRWWPRAVVVLVALLAALVYGVTTTSVQGNLGPHKAQFQVTTDDTVTLDLGPLGTLQIDSPLPLTLGGRIVVQEIPESFTQLDRPTTLQALNGDLNSYLQLFTAPRSTVHDVVRALVLDAVGRTALAFVVLMGVWFLGRWVLGRTRRAELAAAFAPRARQVAVAGAVVVVAATVLTYSVGVADRPSQAVPASAVFDGTALEGARVTGRLGGVIDTYGGQVVAVYRENEQFYADARTSLGAAWDARQALDDELADVDESPSGSPTPGAGHATKADPVVVVLVSDLHCNVGMAPLVRDVVQRTKADLVLDAGDTTMNGTTVEQYCVTTFARAVPQGVDIVTSPGNHDSAETSRTYAQAGATVLSGSVVTVDGIRILGDVDPNETRVGRGTSSAGRESVTEAGKRLADVACDDGDVDLLLIHNPVVGTPTLNRGCSPAQISGHLHKRVGPLRVGQGVQYGSSSTAGAILGQPTVGPLHGVAEMTVLRWDPDTRRFLDYQIVQVRPDRSASVSPRLRWPAIVPSGWYPDVPEGPFSGVR